LPASHYWSNRLHVSIVVSPSILAEIADLAGSGGSVLTTLLNSNHQPIKDLEISALVRGEDRAKVLKEYGVNPIQFRDLDDSEALTKAASENDSKF
jgi:hypothetical protein